MSQVNSAAGSGGTSTSQFRGNDLRNVDLDQFMELMLAELQNQDPLSPLDNSDLLQQITQIREIGATNQLTETLSAIIAGQNLTTSSSLIGKSIKALTSDNRNIEGVVDRATVEVDAKNRDVRKYYVHVGNNKVELNNVREVVE